MYDDNGSEQGPRGTFESYRAEGDNLYKNGEYRKAIESFSTALELQPSDKNCLVARSRCYLQLGDTDNALQDAETSLTDDNTFHKGLFQKAEALYCKGEFELALVFYHRGHKLRPELQEFRLGIQKAQEAIDNSVGSPERVHLTKEGDLSFFEKQDEKKPKAKYASYQKPSAKPQRTPRDIRNTSSDKSVKQLLGELYGDKVYLEKLMRETDPNTESGRSIYDLVCEGLHYLDTRTEFWRQQKPMYARKRDRMIQNARASTAGKTAPNDYIIKNLESIDQAQSDGKYGESLKKARKCLQTVESYPEGAISNREDVYANLYSLMGNAHLEMGQHEKALNMHQKDLDLAEKHDLKDAKSRALDNLGRTYARMGDFQKAIDCWMTKLPASESPLESTWLHHEIGRCYLELGNHAEAKSHGEKSVAAAESAGDSMWQLNATVLIAQSEVKLGDYQFALESFEKALDMSKVQGDTAAEAAIKKAIDDVNAKIADDVRKSSESSAGEVTKYKIKLKTGDEGGSGTNANVHIILVGEDGESKQRNLDNKENNFESGQIDEFTIQCPSVGALKRVRVGHDNAGFTAGWFLDWVSVEDLTTGQVYQFPCNRWLSDDEDDGKVIRDLELDSGTQGEAAEE